MSGKIRAADDTSAVFVVLEAGAAFGTSSVSARVGDAAVPSPGVDVPAAGVGASPRHTSNSASHDSALAGLHQLPG